MDVYAALTLLAVITLNSVDTAPKQSPFRPREGLQIAEESVEEKPTIGRTSHSVGRVG